MFDTAPLEQQVLDIQQHAETAGLPTEQDRLDYLLKEGLWGTDQEKEIHDLTLYLDGLHKSKAKFFRKRDIDSIEIEIIKSQDRLQCLNIQKNELIGFTAEKHASREKTRFYTYVSFYSNKELTKPLFTEEEFDNLDDINALIKIYEEKLSLFTEINIKRLAISAEFLNFFYLCDNKPYYFYGKPVTQLTYYQNELFCQGMYFKNKLSEIGGEIPLKFRDKPDDLIQWIESKKSADEVLKLNEQTGGAASLVGASKEDYENLGLVGPKLDLLSKAKEKGGHLSMADLAALDGD